MPVEKVDWQEVAKRQPKGFMEMNSSLKIIRGPIESFKVDELGLIHINLKWGKECDKNKDGVPVGKWKPFKKNGFILNSKEEPIVAIEDSEEGPRVRFFKKCFLYLDEVNKA